MSQDTELEDTLQRLRDALAAPEHAYGLLIIEHPERVIQVQLSPWYAIDSSRLPASIGPYRIEFEEERPADAL